MEREVEKLNFLFFGADNTPYFSRDDAEQAERDHSQMSLFLLFPYRQDKVITHGMRVGYVDALGQFQVFEIRKARNYEADHYQEITAEHIAISELTDEHFAPAEWTDITAEQALSALLQGTGWLVGNVSATNKSSGNVSMGNVWQDIRTIEQNWNVYIIPRITMAADRIDQRFLDIIPAGGRWRGLRLSLEKNLDDAGVTWDDTNLKTALFGYGKGQAVEGSTENIPLSFADVVWTDIRNADGTTGHPAKPKNQAYLEDDRATAEYGRNGRPRFGFYQNGDISDPNILLEKTWETLKTVSVPDVTIDGTVRDLYRLGMTDVPIELHDIAMVEITPTGVTLQKEIIRYLEDLLNPLASHLTIGAYIPNIIYINREVAEKTYGSASGSRGSGRSQTNEEYKREEFHTEIEANKRLISLSATQEDMSKVEGILRQAGLEIDATTGVLIYHNDEENNLMSKVSVKASEVAASVTADGMSGYLLINNLTTEMGNVMEGKDGKSVAAKIVTAINEQDGTGVVKIEADQVDITGVVTAIWLDARMANIDALFTTNGYSGTIVTNTMTAKQSMTSPTISADNYYFKDENGGLGDKMGTKQVQFFKGGAYEAVKPVAIGSETVMNLRHSHEITITEITSGTDAGKIQITLGEAVATNSTDRIKNFKIADTLAYQNGVSAARAGVVVNAVNWNTPNITDNAQKDHGKYASISGTVQLAYQSGVDGQGNPIMTNVGNPVSIGPQEITAVYNAGFEAGAVEGGAAVVQRTASGLSDTITLPASHTGTATISDNVVLYSDDTESSNFPVRIDASLVYSAGQKEVKPTNTAAGWRWVESGNDSVLQNIVTAANPNVPTSAAKQTAVTVTMPELTKQVTATQAIVKALDGIVATFAIVKGTATPAASWDSQNNRYNLTGTGSFSVGGTSIDQNQGTATLNPTQAFSHGFNDCYNSIALSASSQELDPGGSIDIYPMAKGVYGAAQAANITGKKITISAKAAAVVTPKVSKGTWGTGADAGKIIFTAGTSGENTAGVALSLDVTPGTAASTLIKAKDGTAETGANLTLYVQGDDDYCYITSTAVTPNANNTLARITNPKTVTPVTVDVNKGGWSGGAIEFTPSSGSGSKKAVSLALTVPANNSSGTIEISVVDTASPGSASRPLSAGLSKTLTLTCGDDYATVKDGDTTVAQVPNNKTAPAITASIDSIGLRTAGGVQYVYVEDDKEYAVYVRATGTNVAQKDGTLYIGAGDAFKHGRDSVTITGVERVASCAYDADARTARQDVRFTLSNGNTYTIHENFDAIYRAGMNGETVDTDIDYSADLSSEGSVIAELEEDANGNPLRISIADIYQKGVQAAVPVEKQWFTYCASGYVPIYVRVNTSGSGSDIGGTIIGMLNGKLVKSTEIAFYPYTPVELTGKTDQGYTEVTYGGNTYYVDPDNLKESATDLSIGHRIGIRKLNTTVYPLSTTMTGLIHTGGCRNDISVYLEPNTGANTNYTSAYVSSTDFSSYRANGTTSEYLAEMASKAGYYGRHESTAYSGDIQHKAIFRIVYSDGNEEDVVVSFNSYPKAQDEVIYTYTGYIDANNYVNLRSTSSTSGSVLAQVPDGAAVMCKVDPYNYKEAWMPVQYGGKTGYIQSQYIIGTKAWNDLNTKKPASISLVGVGHAKGSSKKDIGVIVHLATASSQRMAVSYAIESSDYAYDWVITNNDAETYLKTVKQGYYLYHSKSDYSSNMTMRVKMQVTYTNPSKFPAETVVVAVQSLAT